MCLEKGSDDASEREADLSTPLAVSDAHFLVSTAQYFVKRDGTCEPFMRLVAKHVSRRRPAFRWSCGPLKRNGVGITSHGNRMSTRYLAD